MTTIGISTNIRPAKQETYLPGNVIGFSGRDQPGGTSQIVTFIFSDWVSTLENVTVSINQEAPSLRELELWLFGMPPGKIQPDNTPFTMTEKEMANLRAIISFSPFRYKGGVTFQSKDRPINIPQTHVLYGVLVVRNNYIAKGGESFLIVAI